jgi:hypothetical protein
MVEVKARHAIREPESALKSSIRNLQGAFENMQVL